MWLTLYFFCIALVQRISVLYPEHPGEYLMPVKKWNSSTIRGWLGLEVWRKLRFWHKQLGEWSCHAQGSTFWTQLTLGPCSASGCGSGERCARILLLVHIQLFNSFFLGCQGCRHVMFSWLLLVSNLWAVNNCTLSGCEFGSW